jgi:hypothetical protein
MDIKKYANETKIIPLETLEWMAGEKIIHKPLTSDDLLSLHCCELTWGEEEMIFPQIEGLPAKDRQALFNEFEWLEEKYNEYQRLCKDK